MKSFGHSSHGITDRHIYVVSDRALADRRVRPIDVQFLRDNGAPIELIQATEAMLPDHSKGASGSKATDALSGNASRADTPK